MQTNPASAYIADIRREIDTILGGFVSDGPYAHLDFPAIKNPGDSAIWLGERAYLLGRTGRLPAYVASIPDFSAEKLEKRQPEGAIFLRGGGNFGDLWHGNQRFRERVLQRFPDRPVIQLPQSIHFDNAELLDQARRAIGAHPNFILCVRDGGSKSFAEKHFDCRVVLCPDMAFYLGPQSPAQQPEIPLLAMLRDDKERAGEHPDLPIPVEDWIAENTASMIAAGREAKIRSILAPSRMRLASYDAMARARLAKGIKQISRAGTVITDRLHIHIVSLLIGKRHAVLDNSYGKIAGLRSAFPEPAGLTFTAASLDAALEWAGALATA